MKKSANFFITSQQNPRVKHLKKLKDRRAREKSGQYLIEGFRELTRAFASGADIKELYYCSELFLGDNEHKLIENIQAKAETFELSKIVFEKISYRDRADGLIAIAEKKTLGLQDLQKYLKETPNPFLLVAEAIEKPGNLGSIIRSADAVGIDALIVCDQCTDIYNPNVVRSSVGTLFALPIFEVKSSEAIALMKKHHIRIVATSPSAENLYTQVDLKGNIAIIVGTEQLGLSQTWIKAADISVKIPMLGIADSLNVANATTLLLYEVIRQRHD